VVCPTGGYSSPTALGLSVAGVGVDGFGAGSALAGAPADGFGAGSALAGGGVDGFAVDSAFAGVEAVAGFLASAET